MRRLGLALTLACLAAPCRPAAVADCCKIPIPPCQPDQVRPSDANTDPVVSDRGKGGGLTDAIDDQANPEIQQGRLDAEAATAAYTTAGGFFKEDRQQAVIAWNGSREILILSTNEESLVGDMPMLSVMPLPGLPHDIYQADKEAFSKAKKLVVSKLDLGQAGVAGIFMERRIGAHNIFVWKLDEPTDFPKKIDAYVTKKFSGRARALFTRKMFQVIQSYFDRGFRYFAFDLVMVNEKKSTKEAIGYHFDSKTVYYPMVISGASGVGETLVELVVFTRGGIRYKSTDFDRVIVLGQKSVPITAGELAGVDRRMAGLFPEGSPLAGRILRIPGRLEAFKNDFTALGE